MGEQSPERWYIMTKGTVFMATDKLGRTFKYIYKGKIDDVLIRLINVNWNEETVVESEWFNQRTIVEVTQ